MLTACAKTVLRLDVRFFCWRHNLGDNEKALFLDRAGKRAERLTKKRR